jgi:hypothetical protein
MQSTPLMSIEILDYRRRQTRRLIGSAVILSTSAANVAGEGNYMESMGNMEVAVFVLTGRGLRSAEKILQLT